MIERPNRDTDSGPGGRPPPSLISVVIPAYNEAAGIRDVVDEVARVLQGCRIPAEIIVVDDGSMDGTAAAAERSHHEHARVKTIRFSRNFGKEAALLAGLRVAQGQVVVTLDADLQHPPTVIPELIDRWRRGAKVVHAVKRRRDHDSWIVRTRAALFNALMDRLTGIDIRNSSDFKLLDRVAVDAISFELGEHSRFYRGLSAWIGYEAATVSFDVGSRARGDVKMSLSRLVNLATGAIVGYTSAPLRLVTMLGLLTLGFGVLVGSEALLSWWRGDAVSGFATLICTLLLLGSFIMISLGIIGEYIAKIYDEIKARPSYLVESTTGFTEPTPHATTGRARCPPWRNRRSSLEVDAHESRRSG